MRMRARVRVARTRTHAAALDRKLIHEPVNLRCRPAHAHALPEGPELLVPVLLHGGECSALRLLSLDPHKHTARKHDYPIRHPALVVGNEFHTRTMQRRRRVDGCGLIEAYITVEHGLISAVAFKGDFFSAEEPEELAARFVGHTPDRAGYTAALDGVEAARYFAGLQTNELIDSLVKRCKM